MGKSGQHPRPHPDTHPGHHSGLSNPLPLATPATLLIDPALCVRLFTPGCRKLFELADNDLGRPLNEIRCKADDHYLLKDVVTTLRNLHSLESEVHAEDGCWYLRRISVYRSREDRVEGAVIDYADITRLKQVQNELSDMTRTLEQRVEERTREAEAHRREQEQASRERDLFFELSVVPFFVMAKDGYFQRLNPAWTRLFGWSLQELYERPYLDLIHPKDLAGFKADIRKVQDQGQTVAANARFRVRDGSYRWLEWEFQPGDDRTVLGAVRKVSERLHTALAAQRARGEMERPPPQPAGPQRGETRDDHTPLLSGAEFETRLSVVIDSARKYGKVHALLFMRLDRFSTVRESCGALASDELMRQIAAKLQGQLRQRDTLGHLGGDEFAAILENCTAQHASRIANDVLALMHNYRFVWYDKKVQLGMSIGIALIDTAVASGRQALQNADSACRRARENGRDRVYVFTASEGVSGSEARHPR